MKTFYYLNKALGIILLHKKSIRSVAKDKNATMPAVFIGLIGMAIYLGISYTQNASPISFDTTSLPFSAFLPLYFLTGVLLFAFTHLSARLFGSKEPFIHFFRPIMLSSLVDLLSVFTLTPQIGFAVEIILLIWSMIIYYFVIKEAYQLSTLRSIGVLLLPLVVLFVMALTAGVFIGILIAVRSFG